MATEDKEKADVLNAFFTSVFRSQTGYPQVSPLSVLAALAGEQTRPPTIQAETVTDLLLHLHCHKSMGPGEIHPRVLRELAEAIAEPLSVPSSRRSAASAEGSPPLPGHSGDGGGGAPRSAGRPHSAPYGRISAERRTAVALSRVPLPLGAVRRRSAVDAPLRRGPRTAVRRGEGEQRP